MFQSAVNKLTAWYVAALLIIVVLFSLPALNFANNRLERVSVRQGEITQRMPPPGQGQGAMSENFGPQRRAVINEERRQLTREIIFIDFIIVVAGAILSYFFARHTLRPIEEAHEAQSRFTADASHELRTPLATMQAEIEVALRDTKPTVDDLKSTLSSNLEEIARLRNLSDQLLVLTKIDSTGIAKTKFSLSKVIEKRASELEKQQGITIDKSITKKIMTNGDEHLIAEVLTILVDNATRYADVKNPKIAIKLVKNGNSAELIVTDNGAGISETDLPYIFDRFYRGKKSSEKVGHGLGLSLAKEIIEKHGGEIVATNSTGGGAQFTVTLVTA